MTDKLREEGADPQSLLQLQLMAQRMGEMADAIQGQGHLLRDVREQVAGHGAQLEAIASRQEDHSTAIGELKQGLGQVQGTLATQKYGPGSPRGPAWWEQWGRTMAVVLGVIGAIGTGLVAVWQALGGGANQ